MPKATSMPLTANSRPRSFNTSMRGRMVCQRQISMRHCRHANSRSGSRMPTSLKTPLRREARAWVVAGRAEALARLEPLIEAHRARRPVRILGPEYAPSDLDDAAAALVVGDPRLTPRRGLPGVFLRASNGRLVPV